jgi:hypothetical protein
MVEVLAALALATDLGMGQPLGHAIRCALIADGLAGRLGLDPALRAEVVRVGLLRYLGCTADSAEVAAYAGRAAGSGTSRLPASRPGSSPRSFRRSGSSSGPCATPSASSLRSRRTSRSAGRHRDRPGAARPRDPLGRRRGHLR